MNKFLSKLCGTAWPLPDQQGNTAAISGQASPYFAMWAKTVASIEDENGETISFVPYYDLLAPENWKNPISSQDSRAGEACSDVGFGLKIAIVFPIHPQVKKSLVRGLEIAHRTLLEGPYWKQNGMFRNSPPEYKAVWLAHANGLCHFAIALGESFLSGSPVVSEHMRLASDGFVAKARDAPPGYRGYMDQSDYLKGVICALLAGDIAQAKALFKPRKGFKATRHFHALMKNLTLAIAENPYGIPAGHPVHEEFQRFFYIWRIPGEADYKADPENIDEISQLPEFTLFKISLALLKDRYLNNFATPDWVRVLAYLTA